MAMRSVVALLNERVKSQEYTFGDKPTVVCLFDVRFPFDFLEVQLDLLDIPLNGLQDGIKCVQTPFNVRNVSCKRSENQLRAQKRLFLLRARSRARARSDLSAFDQIVVDVLDINKNTPDFCRFEKAWKAACGDFFTNANATKHNPQMTKVRNPR